jgi:membrane-bound serine protease (ClpP class)
LSAFTVCVVALSLTAGDVAADDRGLAYSTAIQGEISPRAEHALERAMQDARRQRAELVILRLDTPGGDGASMREMARLISAAPMPVVVYVHPDGARADSAGMILTLAADVAAMAPLTNIGSATPVWIGPPARSASEDQVMRDLRRKAINDGVAFARTLADAHGRNADLAEQMVRVAKNVSARVAEREGLVDVVAPTERALLRSLDGFTVKGHKAQKIQTAGLELRRFSDAVDVGEPFDPENSSFWRSFAYVFGAAGLIVATVIGSTRGRASWRRRQRRRRRTRAQQR